MKKYWLFILTFTQLSMAQVTGINTTTTSPSAALEIKSTTGGFLAPRMTQAQRDALTASAAIGLMIYNTTTNSYETYNGLAWFSLTSKDTNPTTSGNAIISSYQLLNPSGPLKVGVTASLQLKVYVTQLGTYHFSTTTANGISFEASGTFSSLGLQTIPLSATGTPLAVGFYTYTLQNVVLPPAPLTIATIDQHTVVGAAGKIWMAYNLGATAPATSPTDYTQYGSLYQWGRGNDGHQLIIWASATAGTPVNGTTTTLSDSDTPGHSKFIITSASPNDWRNPQNNALWQGVNGINNPCPAGYRIPSYNELLNELYAGNVNSKASAFSSPLKLVGNSTRKESGVVEAIGFYFWTSNTTGATNLGLPSGNLNLSILSTTRSFGLNVRCIKD